jgi:large subunit ribosomal protein L30
MADKKQDKQIKITLVKSGFGVLKNQKANLEALGLRRIGDENTFSDDAVVRGMIKKVAHLVKVEQI